MRHQHDVDVLRVDTGGGQVEQRAPNCAFGGLKRCDAVTAINQDQLAARVNELRVERYRHHAGRHVRRLRRSQRLLLGHIGHPIVGHRERARPIVDRGAFVTADLVAVEARRLHPNRGDRGCCRQGSESGR